MHQTRRTGWRDPALTIALGAAPVAGLAVPASAATHRLSGTLSCIGTLTQYDTFRVHARGGASITVSSFTSIAAGGVNYGLRSKNGTQVTRSLNFVRSELNGSKRFTTTQGSATIPQGHFAVNARHVTKSTGCGFPLPSWSGSLSL